MIVIPRIIALSALAVFTAAFLLSAQADVAGLECMADRYDSSTLGEIESLSVRFVIDEEGESMTGDQLGSIAADTTLACFEQHGWSDGAVFSAVLYEVGRLTEAAYRRSGALTLEQLDKIDAALASDERPELWTLLERGVLAGMDGEEPDFTAEEQFTLGMFVHAAEVPTDDDTAEKVGVLLGFMALQRYGAREFNSAQGGQ